MSDRRDEARRISDRERAWVERHAVELAALVLLQFVVLAALAVGIAVTSSTAQHALAVNERRERETSALRADVRKLTTQNGQLTSEVAALRTQVEGLGGVPVTVTIDDQRSGGTSTQRPTPTSTTTTTQPRPTTTSTTAPPPPCQVQVGGRCVVPG